MRTIKNILALFVTDLALICLGTLTSIIIARTLGAESRGVYSLVFNSVALSSCFLGLGLSSSNIYYLSKNKNKFSLLFSNTISYLAFISIILGLFFLNFENLIYFIFPKSFDFSFLLLLGLVFLTIFSDYLKSFFIALNRIKEFNGISLTSSLFTLIFIIIFIILLKINVIGVFYAWALASLISISIYLKKLFKTEIFKFNINIQEFITSLKLGFKSLTINIIGFLMMRIDIFIISSFLGMKILGLYSIAIGLGELLNKVPFAISQIVFPKVTCDDNNELDNHIVQSLRIIFFFSIIFGLILFLLSDFIVLFLFGQEFIETGNILKFLIIGNIFTGISMVITNYIAGKKEFPLVIYTSQGLSALSNILLNLILIPYWGIYGSAIACSVSYFVAFIIVLKYFAQLINSSYNDILFIKKQDFAIVNNYIKKIIVLNEEPEVFKKIIK